MPRYPTLERSSGSYLLIGSRIVPYPFLCVVAVLRSLRLTRFFTGPVFGQPLRIPSCAGIKRAYFVSSDQTGYKRQRYAPRIHCRRADRRSYGVS